MNKISKLKSDINKNYNNLKTTLYILTSSWTSVELVNAQNFVHKTAQQHIHNLCAKFQFILEDIN